MTRLLVALGQRWTAAGFPMPLTLGRACGNTLPAASLTHSAGRSLATTNSSDRFDELELELRLWHSRHDAGQELADQARGLFDRAAFALAGGRVLGIRRTAELARQQFDGVWEFYFCFVVHVYWEAA